MREPDRVNRKGAWIEFDCKFIFFCCIMIRRSVDTVKFDKYPKEIS